MLTLLVKQFHYECLWLQSIRMNSNLANRHKKFLATNSLSKKIFPQLEHRRQILPIANQVQEVALSLSTMKDNKMMIVNG